MVDNNDSKFLLEEMNAIQVKHKVNKNSLAVLVLGSCENHGDHLPFGSDFIFPFCLVQQVVDNILKKNSSIKSDFIVLPAMPYGVSIHHNDFQMTMSLRFSTMISVIEDLIGSLAKNGIKRVLVINGHDGNISPIEVAARNLKDLHPDLVISCLESWWVLVGKKNKDMFNVWNGLGHGGEAETSAMMAVRPDLVDIILAPEQIVPNLPTDDIRLYWKFNELTKTGATGAPKQATIKKGQEIIKILEQVLFDFITKMDHNDWTYGVSATNTFN